MWLRAKLRCYRFRPRRVFLHWIDRLSNSTESVENIHVYTLYGKFQVRKFISGSTSSFSGLFFITVDETWILTYQAPSLHWKKNSPCAKIVHSSRSKLKQYLSFSSTSRTMVRKEWVRNGQAVNQRYYKQVLDLFLERSALSCGRMCGSCSS